MSGQLILSLKEDFNSIDVSNFSQGVYFIKIKTDKGEVNKKIIKR